MRLLTSLLLASLVLAGCRAPSGAAARASKKDPYLILAEELATTQRDNLFDAVRQVRPTWFSRISRQQSGDASIMVYLEDRQIGEAATLRRFSVQSVASVRYLAPTEAQVRFGQANGGRPAIVLEAARSQ